MTNLQFDKSSVAKQNLDIPKPLDTRYSPRPPGDPGSVVYRQPSGAVNSVNEAGGEVPRNRYGR
jgi:hypothetical protein